MLQYKDKEKTYKKNFCNCYGGGSLKKSKLRKV